MGEYEIRNLFFLEHKITKLVRPSKGNIAGDNFRFIRFMWEVFKNDINFKSNSQEDSHESIVKWYPYMKGGIFQRWYGNQDYVINWQNNDREIRKHPKFGERNPRFHFKKGATYTKLTISDLNARLMPSGFLCDDTGGPIYEIKDGGTLISIGILNSKLGVYLCKMLNPTVITQSGDISRIPFSNLFESSALTKEVTNKVKECIEITKKKINRQETDWEFVLPFPWKLGNANFLNIERTLAILETDISEAVYRLYEISDSDIEQIESEFGTLPGKLPKVDDFTDPRLQIIERLYLEKHVPDEVINQVNQEIDEDDSGEEPSKGRGRQKRFLTFEELCLASGFHPDTVYGYIVDNNLERPEERYKLAVQWGSYATGVVLCRFKPGQKGELGSGIDEDGTVLLDADFDKLNKLVDDDGIMVLNPGHPDELPARVEEALTVLLGEKDCKYLISVLGGDLRKFFEREFFTKWHLPMYRKRPVYWLLQSAKKSYGIYLFHERLTGDSLFLIREKYVEPKISLEKNHLAELKGRLFELHEGKEKRNLEKEIEKLEGFIDELAEFQKNIRGITDKGYDPDINDGVILNMAPLHRIIPWTEPKKYWQELKDEKYDWAHIAMKYWPDRVREKCKTDKSLTIAHGLEV